MTRLFKLISIFFLMALLSACASQAFAQSSSVHLTEKDAGKTVNLKPGDTLIIELEGNASTGYSWEAASQDLQTLKQTGDAVVKDADPNLMGAPHMVVLTYTAQAAGQETLKLVYHRSWEKNTDPAKTFEISVVVK